MRKCIFAHGGRVSFSSRTDGPRGIRGWVFPLRILFRDQSDIWRIHGDILCFHYLVRLDPAYRQEETEAGLLQSGFHTSRESHQFRYCEVLFTRKKEREKYYAATDAYRAIERPYITRYLFLQIGTALLLGGMMFGCFSVAISAYFSGRMSVGDVASIVALVSVLLPGLMVLANEWRNIMKYLTDLEPFFELLETRNTVIDKPDPTSVKLWSELTKSDPYSIQFNHITFHYPDRVAIFDDLSLAFHPGKSYGIVGRSGAGKTTLMKLLLRFYDLQSGSIMIN